MTIRRFIMRAYLILKYQVVYCRNFEANNLAMKILKECKLGKISLINPRTLLVDIAPKSEIGIEHIRTFKNMASEIACNQKLFGIVNYGELSLPTREARELVSRGRIESCFLARAVVVHDMGQMIIERHTLRRRKKACPAKVFTSLDDAIHWIDDIRLNNIESQSFAQNK